ncbi:MAG TPA: hypothetical protein VGP26_22205 [Actinophytocola sp.]|jgi:hypothetical protein|nr:hypothetical protein [Actinophytocola sp.]
MGADQAARSTMLVAQAGRDLRDALGDPERAARAAERLAGTAEAGIVLLGAAPAEGIAVVPEDTEALLAAALSQLGVAGTLFAASEAVGEHGPAEPSALDEPLRRLDATAALLTRPPVRGIAAPPPSATAADALAGLRRQVDRTVDALISRSTNVISGSLTGVHERGPAEVRKAWDTINDTLHLDEFGGKLARIGLRALRGALALLARIVPASWLAGIRTSVDHLIESTDGRGPAKAIVGAAIGADRLAAPPAADLSTLDLSKLDRGAADLAELTTKYGKLMDLCGGVGTAIGVAAKLTGVLRLTAPQLGVLILAGHVLVIGGVVVLGRDHVDAGLDPGDGGRGLVRGVRTIVGEATA